MNHVTLAAVSSPTTSRADLAGVLGPSTYRLIGGHMVAALVARWQLGAELYRETGDADRAGRTTGPPSPILRPTA